MITPWRLDWSTRSFRRRSLLVDDLRPRLIGLSRAGLAPADANSRRALDRAVPGLRRVGFSGSRLRLAAHVAPYYKETHVFIWVVLATLVVRCLNLCLTAFIQAMGAYHLILWISLANFLSIASFVCTGGALWGPVGAAVGVTVGESLNFALQGRTLR